MHISEVDDLHRRLITIKYINDTNTKWTSYFFCKAHMDSLAKFERIL